MQFKNEKYQRLAEDMIANPILRNTAGCYDYFVKKHGVSRDTVRKMQDRLEKEGKVPPRERNKSEYARVPSTNQSSFTEKGDEAFVKTTSPVKIKTLEELIAHCEIDTSIWNVKTWECTAWNSMHKDEESNAHIHQLFRVWARLERILITENLEKQKSVLLDEFSNTAPRDYQERLSNYYRIRNSGKSFSRDLLYESAIFDLHIGKLAWKEETGENYDSAEAVKRFVTANEVLLGRVDINRIEKILIPLGNDMIHIDNRQGMTANGTPQDIDSRYYKMIRTAKHMLVDTIDKFLDIAPVEIVIVPGNHDFTTMFNIGEILDAWYRNVKFVNIYNAPTQRKFYQYGKVGFMFTHGDEEKITDLPQIFAATNKQLWADTEFRQIQIGHFHKKKTIAHLTMDSFPGVEVKILSSLSGTDAYHARKGYSAPKKAEALMFHKDEGQVGEFFYNLPS